MKRVLLINKKENRETKWLLKKLCYKTDKCLLFDLFFKYIYVTFFRMKSS